MVSKPSTSTIDSDIMKGISVKFLVSPILRLVRSQNDCGEQPVVLMWICLYVTLDQFQQPIKMKAGHSPVSTIRTRKLFVSR